ncbi:LCP family protein [Streptomyces sp. RPT161]|uniref:LCP family protein n=1 Tax=Streptomyces sp. RPT161 TaxID=3015993 RepID=UPI0022B91C04|nr:LCP family protein [Streptomyces sp. RPT161]
MSDREGPPARWARRYLPARPPGDPRRRPLRRQRWLRCVALASALLLVVGAGVIWLLYEHLEDNIRTDTGAEAELRRHMAERPPPGANGTDNVLIIGTDSRGGDNGAYGADSGTARSDTVILLHLAAGRGSATAVSIPRDLMVNVPSCRKPDGHQTTAQFAQFNWSFAWGGAACTIRTVEQLTGIRVDHHVQLDFTGFKRMVDAVNGVEVCVPYRVHDRDAKLDLAAGRQLLHGEQALGYVRSRHGFGDGSDTERMDRQQGFLASLVRKMQSNGVLYNPAKLYPVLDAATSSITADPGLNSLTKLYDVIRGLQKTPTDQIRFLTVPREPYVDDYNRDQLMHPQADQLFAALRADQLVAVRPPAPTSTADQPPQDRAGGDQAPPGADDGKAPPPSPSTMPTYLGTTAAHDGCDQKHH